MKANLHKQVNSNRFLDRSVKKLVRSWIRLEEPRQIPWTSLSKPLAESTVALVTSAGLALKTDQPFDQEGERQNPWWSDPSFRVLPRTVAEEDINLYHLHIHPRIAEEDINTFFPVTRLLELEQEGMIGRSAAHHYSYIGYTLQPHTLLKKSVPAMIEQMKQDSVSVVVLIPG